MKRSAAVLPAVLILAALPCRGQVANSAPPAPWWHAGTCYEVFVRSFYDADGDGVGDLRGLTMKLDYIGALGASCIWLMPVAQSPSYHGYDVTNYYEVNRDYGTTEDFRRFVAEAHRRGIRVIVDLVLNHTSSEHPFFRSALLDPRSPYRDWFLWSPTQRRTAGWSVPTWHKVPRRDEWYYGLFWSGMPDLNLANPAVTAEAQRVARYWLEEMDVDGFRLDAVGHFFERGEDPRNGPGTHPWLRDYAAFIERVRPGAFTVGEVMDSIGAVRNYYPDQLTAYFGFELADSLIGAVRHGSRRGLLAVLERMLREYPAGRWGAIQRNHDQTRSLTEYGGDLARARLSATLLLTMPGVPFVYYGEEIGMTGDKHDGDPRLRTPMHWALAPAAGFTRGRPWEPLPPDSFTANVAPQDGDAGSLLNHYRRMIRLRAAHPALGATASFVPLAGGPDAALAYLRRGGEETVVVVANLGATPLPGVALTSALNALPPGTWTVTDLLGGAAPPPAPLRVRRDGRISGWVPAAALEPFAARVYSLARRAM